jgi:hypothetical protein
MLVNNLNKEEGKNQGEVPRRLAVARFSNCEGPSSLLFVEP